MTVRRQIASPMWNAPTLLTASRIALAPVVLRQIRLGRHGSALFWLITAGLTDIADGMLARFLGEESAFGQLLDPVADKLLLSSVYIGLARAGDVPWAFVTIVFGRDAVLLAGSGVLLRSAEPSRLKPSAAGKASTFFQITAAGTFIGANALASRRSRAVARALLWPAAILTAVSGLQYLGRGLTALRRH